MCFSDRFVSLTSLCSYFELLPDNTNVRTEHVVAFLWQLRQSLAGGPTVVWDRHRIHSRSRLVRAWLAEHSEVQVADFPAYAPELNPDKGVWSWLRYGQLANLAADHTDPLCDRVVDRLIELKYQPDLLAAFIHQTDLPVLYKNHDARSERVLPTVSLPRNTSECRRIAVGKAGFRGVGGVGYSAYTHKSSLYADYDHRPCGEAP